MTLNECQWEALRRCGVPEIIINKSMDETRLMFPHVNGNIPVESGKEEQMIAMQ